jgi:hypothetical protein
MSHTIANPISIFTFFAIGLEVMNLWAARRETLTHEKHPEGHRAPLDAPAANP